MVRLMDYMAGVAGCTTDMSCQQLSTIFFFGTLIFCAGLFMMGAGMIMDRYPDERS